MSKKITQKQLRRMIIAETKNLNTRKPVVKTISPKQRKRILEAKQRKRILEAKAEIAHIELLEEGFFDAIKSVFKTGASIMGAAGKAVGGGISKMASAAQETANSYATAIKDIADEKVKAVATEYHKNIADSLKSAIQTKSKEMMSALIKAGVSEEEAKGQVAMAVQAAASQALVDTGK